LTRTGKAIYVDQRIAAAMISDLSLEPEPYLGSRAAS